MALLTLKDVHKTYDDRHLLRGVELVVDEGDRIGLVGPNGAGKSTLLRILAGSEQADEGRRTEQRGLRVGYLEQEPALAPHDRVRDAVRRGLAGRQEILAELDEVHQELACPGLEPPAMERLLARQARLDDRLEALGGHDVEHQVETFVDRLGLRDPEARCSTLSGGERRRVALAQLLLADPDCLLLDEPTNHLDVPVTDWLEDHLLQLRGTLVLVTHDRYFLDRLVTRIVELDGGVLHDYQGGYGAFLRARAERLARQQRAESTRLNLLRRESEWMRRGPPARSTKAKARIQRYQDLVDQEPEPAARELAFEIPPGPRLGERVIELCGVEFAYGDQPILRHLDLEIAAGTRLGIIGPNGAGKSTFLKLCMGQLQPAAGRVVVGSTVRFASIDQGRSELEPARTVLEEVAGERDHVQVGSRLVRVETFLDQFLFPGNMKHTPVGKLSGGERNRVLLAKLLSAGGNVLVLDEPTNDLDLMGLRVLEEALVAFPGVVLVVSHDRFFLDRAATRILYLDGRGGARVHEGDVSGLLEKLAAELEAAAPAVRLKPAAAVEPAAKVRKLSTRERAELDALPERIQAAEDQLAELDAQLADPALYQDGGDRGRAEQLTARRTAAQAGLDALYGRWEELEAIADGTVG